VAQLIYSTITSLDGYVEDQRGIFDWAAPDEEVLRFINDLERPIGTYLYGRRMYETMQVWETEDAVRSHSDPDRDFAAIWRAAEKVVFSATLSSAATSRTRIERTFEPAVVGRWKGTTSHDMTVGGATLAGEALKAGLVDELQLFAVPVVVGGGKRALPADVFLDLTLLDVRRFEGGVVFLRYHVATRA
jgi:dihydrofolate reductase